MKKILATALVFSSLSTMAMADMAFQCSDRNTSLLFTLYEDNSGMRGGHMYINNIQVARLDTYRVNDISVRGNVVGNGAEVEFVFNSSRQAVYIEIGNTSELVCNAQVTDN